MCLHLFFLLITSPFHSEFQSHTFMAKDLAKIMVHSPLIFISLLQVRILVSNLFLFVGSRGSVPCNICELIDVINKLKRKDQIVAFKVSSEQKEL